MNVYQLSAALGLIDNDLLEEAANVGVVARIERPIKRIGIAVWVAVLLMIVSFSTALAVNTDFREAVINFFKLRTPETVAQGFETDCLGDITIVSGADIEGRVAINYLKIDGYYEYNDGVIFSYREDRGYANGSYYSVENNELVPLKVKRMETTFCCRGLTWSVRFDYMVIDGKLYIHNLPDSRMSDAGTEAIFCYASAMKDGSTDKVLLTLPFPHSNFLSYSEYVVEMDMGTCRVTDFMSECGLNELTELVHKISFSDDLSNAVITCFDSGYNGTVSYYYCDIKNQELVLIRDITDVEVDDCWLLDNVTLFYTTQASKGMRMNLTTGEKESVYENYKIYADDDGGVQFLGGKYALLINTDRQVWLMNLSTGSKTFIDGLKFTTLSCASLNEDQTKIYFRCYNNDDLEIGNLGLLDIPEAKMIMLDRDGQEIRREWNVEWFDNDRIVFNATDGSRNNYLYLYEFRN